MSMVMNANCLPSSALGENGDAGTHLLKRQGIHSVLLHSNSRTRGRLVY